MFDIVGIVFSAVLYDPNELPNSKYKYPIKILDREFNNAREGLVLKPLYCRLATRNAPYVDIMQCGFRNAAACIDGLAKEDNGRWIAYGKTLDTEAGRMLVEHFLKGDIKNMQIGYCGVGTINEDNTVGDDYRIYGLDIMFREGTDDIH